jgi:nicotinate-nucleotide adenylyltransferase
MKKIGILGGTFNPVHNGHLHIARGFGQRLGLDRVLLIPVWSPPHKDAEDLLPGEQRLEMCRLAAQGDPLLGVSDLEVKRRGKSYTSDTLRELRRLCPEDRLYFILGADMFLTLEQWRHFDRMAHLAVFCTAARHPGELRQLLDAAVRLRGRYGVECEVEDLPVLDISSTHIRGLLSRGEDASELLPPPVRRYIEERGLYRETEDRKDVAADGSEI